MANHPLPRIVLSFLLLWQAAGWLLPPAHRAAKAAAHELIVTDSLTLGPAESPYSFSYVEVRPGGQLTIEAGTELLFAAGGKLSVFGLLRARGTAEQPVRLAGLGNARWDGLEVGRDAPPATISHLILEGFQGPLRFFNQQDEFGDLSLVDGVDNSIQLGRPDGQYGSPYLHDLEFANRLSGRLQQGVGLTLLGSFQDVRVEHVHMSDGRLPSSLDWQRIGFSLIGSYRQLQLTDFQLPSGCPLTFQRLEPHRAAVAVGDPQACHPKLRPVIFVPGFGGSINLRALTAPPEAPPSLDGWHFLTLLTPAYTHFLADLTSRGIPYEVAYYDWRLPADQAARLYLEPAIAKAKKKYGVDSVDLVAHSYGGLVSRAYVQGDSYQGDVQQLVLLGTPNRGAAKAYPPWEGGQVPSDWEPLLHLLRFYQYRYGGLGLTAVGAVRRFFPSVADLQPVYPAIYKGGEPLDPERFFQPNRFLLQLRQGEEQLRERTVVTSVVSSSEPTQRRLDVEGSSNGEAEWPDGRPSPTQFLWQVEGDGTVPLESARLEGVPTYQLEGAHQELPALAEERVASVLYPELPRPPLSFFARARRNLSFLFDCPVQVEIRLPDGSLANSEGPSGAGEVESSSDLLWMLLPRLLGQYNLRIRALADTPVRWWVEDGPIENFSLHSGEIRELVHLEAEAVPPSPPPSPSPFAAPFPPAQPPPGPPPTAFPRPARRLGERLSSPPPLASSLPHLSSPPPSPVAKTSLPETLNSPPAAPAELPDGRKLLLAVVVALLLLEACLWHGS